MAKISAPIFTVASPDDVGIGLVTASGASVGIGPDVLASMTSPVDVAIGVAVVSGSIVISAGGDTFKMPADREVAVILMVSMLITGKNETVGPSVPSAISVAAGVPIGVAVTAERGGVGVIVPPPIRAVGRDVPIANAVKSGDGVIDGIGVGVSCR